MSLNQSNKFDLLFLTTSFDGFDRVFIVYYVTTNVINFYRMNYPVDSILEEKLQDSRFDVNKFIISCIEKRHKEHKSLSFEDMRVNMSSWGKISFDKAHQYYLQQNREIKINQIL